MRLVLIRHGATRNNLAARYTGQSDIALSSLGERQAQAVGKRLAETPIQVLVSSDLQRARATAEAIARYHGIQVQEDPDLREVAMGEWEGATYAELEQRAPEALTRWRNDPLSFAPPGGETLAQFRDRLVRAFERWRALSPDDTVVWVTHGGAIGILLCHVLGLDLRHRWQFRRDNATITELDVGSERVILMRLNDGAHLEGLVTEGELERSQVL